MLKQLTVVLSCIFTCVFTTLFTSVALADVGAQLRPVATPVKQKIHLKLDPSQDSFTGETTLHLRVTRPTDFIEVSGRDYKIKSAQLSGDISCKDMSHVMLETAKQKLSCSKTLTVGEYTLSISFSAPYNKQSVGLYKTIDRETPYLFTQFEMMDARRAFPLFDEPRYKIPFQLTITAPKGQGVYTNTPLLDKSVQGEWVTHTFAETKPIPSYLIALAVGPLEERNIKNERIPMSVLTTQGKADQTTYALKTIPKVLSALESYFGTAYPYRKLDSIAVPEFAFGAMENAGLITYREDLLLLNEERATRQQRINHIEVVAHELAHQWYGNLVTMLWWDDLWLNEAFASWMGEKITAQLHPELELHLRLPQNNVMQLDAQVSTKAIRKPIKSEADIMDGLSLAYSKGSALLTMIERWVGPDRFQAGIRAYLKRFAFKNAEASDLWDALSEASGKEVKGVLSSFIEQPSFPLIEFTIEGKRITLTQRRFQLVGQEVKPQTWTVPVMIKYGVGDEIFSQEVLMKRDQPSTTVELTRAPEWIYPDEGGVGYYRWSLPPTWLEALLKRSRVALSDRERKALLATVESLLDAGLLKADSLLATLVTAVNDPHPKIALSALNLIKKQVGIFRVKGNKELWKRLFVSTLKPVLARIGESARAGEDPSRSELRAGLVTALGLNGEDQEIIKRAQREATRFLRAPDEVDPYLSKPYLILAARHGDLAFLKQLRASYQRNTNPQHKTQFLLAMGNVGAPELQEEILKSVLQGEFAPPDAMYVLFGMGQGAQRSALFRAWTFKHFDEVIKRLPPYIQPMLPRFLGVRCDLEVLAKVESSLRPKSEALPGLGRELDKLSAPVKSCVALRARDLEVVNRFLSTRD